MALSPLRDRAFRLFWTAQVISALGSGVGSVALPLTAVSLLHASAMDMGVLIAASQVPVLFLALHAGVFVDRLPRRPIIIATNIARGVFLAAVPAAAAAGVLRIQVLWVVALATGVLAVVFDLAVTSYPPTLVPREELVAANSTLSAGGQAAQIAGPGAAGWLVKLLGAPATVLVDAASFVIAGLMQLRLPRAPAAPRPPTLGVVEEIREGFATVWNDTVLRAMVIATAIGSFGGALGGPIFVLNAVRRLHVSAPALGIIYATGSVVGLVASVLAGRLAKRLRAGGAMLGGQLVHAVGAVLLVVAPKAAGAVVVAVAQACMTGGLTVFSITQISLRQAVTPPHLLGRVNATRRVIVFGVIPFGALIGGWLGSAVGLRAALIAAAAVDLLALVAIVASPLRKATETEDARDRGEP